MVTANNMANFLKTYISECKDLLRDMENLLLNLDQENASSETLNAIFRCAHSIKGGSGVFGFTRLTKFTHILESLLDNLRGGTININEYLVDTLLEACDALKKMVDTVEHGDEIEESFAKDIEDNLLGLVDMKKEIKAIAPKDITSQTKFYSIKFSPHQNILKTGNEPQLIFRELSRLGKVNIDADGSCVPSIIDLNPQDCYLNFNIELETNEPYEQIKEVFEFVEDNCDLEIKEFAGIFNPATPKHAVNDINESGNQPLKPVNEVKGLATGVGSQNINTIRVDVDKIDRLVNLVGELVISRAMIVAQAKNISFEQHPGLIKGIEELSYHTRELQEAVMSARMQPVKSLFSRMPRLVRDLSRKLGKDIKIELYGEGTEVDKTIIEQLSDPLMHMIRNSVDHGIETPEERIKCGKPGQGTIKLSADQRSGKIVIEVKDDGVGINREKVLQTAIAKDIVSRADSLAMTAEQIDNLVFAAGFSTANQVSDISGRGVGMDVVKRNIESIGGIIELRNKPGEGLHCLVYIPLTLAILDGMIIGVGGERYIIPISSIMETLRPKHNEIQKIGEDNDLINVRGEFIPIHYLSKLFQIPGANNDPGKALIVIVETSTGKYGLVVDELIGQQQVVIKSLDENSANIEGVSGATILGDGRVALILDMAKLQQLGHYRQKKSKKVV